ncbi:MAG: hypothetical protein GY821_16410 [Gammaproteobacteria bacterium]|nr:hypothetical protein [Gammaproteobacteria bacterium]
MTYPAKWRGYTTMVTKKYSIALALASTSFLSLAMAGSLNIRAPSEESSGKAVCAYCSSGGVATWNEVITMKDENVLDRMSFMQLYHGAGSGNRGKYSQQNCQIFLVDPNKFSEGDECSPTDILSSHSPASINFIIADDKKTANVTSVNNASAGDFITDPTGVTTDISTIKVQTNSSI